MITITIEDDEDIDIFLKLLMAMTTIRHAIGECDHGNDGRDEDEAHE